MGSDARNMTQDPKASKNHGERMRNGGCLWVIQEKWRFGKASIFVLFVVGVWQCITFNSRFMAYPPGTVVDLSTKPAFNDPASRDGQRFSGKNTANEERFVQARTLWLTTCETRHNSTMFQTWNRSAHRFVHDHYELQRRNGRSVHLAKASKQHGLKPAPNSNAITDEGAAFSRKVDNDDILWRPQVRNLCSESTAWDGMKTKIHAVLGFLNGTALDNEETPLANDIVMFTDSDSIFNSFAWNTNQVVSQFEHTRMGKPILVSAEPACYVGLICDKRYLRWLYPNATKRSNCPQFLNSGQYMGHPRDLTNMLEWVSNYLGTSTAGDQRAVSIYRVTYPELIALDTRASVFRSMTFGMINAASQGMRTCGTDGVGTCGNFKRFKRAIVNDTSGNIVMEPVPGDCQESYRPFSIHFPGQLTRRILRRVAKAIDKYVESVQ